MVKPQKVFINAILYLLLHWNFFFLKQEHHIHPFSHASWTLGHNADRRANQSLKLITVCLLCFLFRLDQLVCAYQQSYESWFFIDILLCTYNWVFNVIVYSIHSSLNPSLYFVGNVHACAHAPHTHFGYWTRVHALQF